MKWDQTRLMLKAETLDTDHTSVAMAEWGVESSLMAQN